MTFIPSGAQQELRAGTARAIVVEVGGGLREYTVAGRHLLDGYALDELCTGGRGQLLVPWPNRVRAGRYSFGGQSHQLALTEAAQGNAIHGLTRFAPWTVDDRDASRLRLVHTVHPQPGYPFGLAASVDYELSETGLEVTVAVRNRCEVTAPVGIGAHPYLRAGAGTVDEWALHLPAAHRLLTDAQQIPTAAEPVAGTAYDFGTPRLVGTARLDTAYTELERDAAGNCRVELRAADGSGVALVAGPEISHLMAFTGDTLADAGQRRRGLAVEPMTCAPNAFNSDEGLRELAPGGVLRARWRLEPLQAI